MATRIKSDLAGYAGCMTIFGVALTAGGVGGLVATWGRADMPLWVRGLLVALACAGALGLVAAAMSALRLRKFGQVWLELEEARIGGAVAGVIEAGLAEPPTGDGTLTLTCSRTVQTGNQKNRSSRTATLHTQSVTVPRDRITADAGKTRIPVRMEVPPGLPPRGPSRDEQGRPGSVSWELTCHVPVPGMHLVAPFQLPIEG
jgi:hypothetical protein